MIWLGVDVETTGLDLKNDRIVEMGIVMWDAHKAKPKRVLNFAVWAGDFPPISPFITKLTGIEPDYYKDHFVKPVQAMKVFSECMEKADYVVGHNIINFDGPMLKAEAERHPEELKPMTKTIIDSSVDVPYPPEITTRKLIHLAAEHGFLNPFAHRAVFDVLTMFKVMSCYPVEEILKYAQADNLQIKAKVTKENREQAKSRGYRWDSTTLSWLKTVKDFQLEQERKSSPFEIVVLK